MRSVDGSDGAVDHTTWRRHYMPHCWRQPPKCHVPPVIQTGETECQRLKLAILNPSNSACTAHGIAPSFAPLPLGVLWESASLWE